MPHVALFLLGPPRIERDGEPVEVDTRKAIALAAYLALSGESHARDELATLLWPLSDQARARAALRRTLSSLRKAIGEEKVETDSERIALRPGVNFRVDVDEFQRLLAECHAHGHAPEEVCPTCLTPLKRAIDLYRADFLTGFTLRDSPGFDEWQTYQTEGLRLELASALERLVRCHSDQWEFEPAIAYARRWTALDPIHVLPNYLLMQLYTWAGQRSAALRQYREYVEALENELGAPPEKEITQLYETVRNNQDLPLPALAVPVPSDNLPLQPTPFVGREEELQEIGQLLDDRSCRLVTLFGPGGIGKTRLALRVAAQRRVVFPHGVYFVPLAQKNSADRIVPSIADSLQLVFRGREDPKEQLLNFLREKAMLLVLDNFEHLLRADATALLVEILSKVPNVKLLVTSRERLNLQWEWPFEVRGLRFPQNGTSAAPEAYSAVQLFLQSARRAHPGFSLSEAERPFIVRICRSLEGMPLGIELAAAWVEVSSCQQIAQEIERNLDFLTTSRRDVPERHRSLQAAFGHSWELLGAEERSVLSNLSVFRGGFRSEAAERVSGASLSHLSALMHKSFLRRSPGGRYEMLVVLRQYAEDRLQQSPQALQTTHDRHCAYYAEFLRQRHDALDGANPQRALDEIGEEIDNIRTAWQWAVAHRKWEQIEQSLQSMYRFYEVRSWFQEGEEALKLAVQALGTANKAVGDDRLLAKIQTRQAWLRLKLTRFRDGKELLEASLAALRRLNEPQETALALNHLGVATAWLGELDEAARKFEESIGIYDALGDRIGLAKSLNNIGLVAMIQKRLRAAKLLLQESLTLREESSDLSGMADSLSNLGHVAEAMGDYAAAKGFHQRCLAISIEIGDRWGMANSLCSLGFAFCALGENPAAWRCFEESLESAVDLQSTDLILENLVGIATLLAAEGEAEQAVELVACVLHHPAIAGQAQERAEELLSELEDRLPLERFEMAHTRGQGQEVQHYVQLYGVGLPTF